MEKKIKINKNGNCRFCQEKDDKEDMVACDDCDRWFHLSCVDLFEKPGKKDPWICCKCNEIKLQMKAQEDQIKILMATPNKENNYFEAFEALIEKIKGCQC